VSQSPPGTADFDRIMGEDDQNRWLNDLSYVDMAGDRLVNPDLRRRYYRHYVHLIELLYSQEIIEVLRKYVSIGIPAIRRGELSFWSCSCLPDSDKTYARINIYAQEVFAAGVFEGTPFFSWYLARTPLRGVVGQWGLGLRLFGGYGAWFTTRHYRPGGEDQINVQIWGSPSRALRFIGATDVGYAIRVFNWRLMRQGANLYGGSHCMSLADRLVK
jgi:hypothetical protein